MPDVDLPDLTEKQLDADGDGTVTPDDIALLKSEGIPTQSIEAALDKMSARLTKPEQMDALQDLRSALASPSNAMQPGLGWALIPVLVGWLWMRRLPGSGSTKWMPPAPTFNGAGTGALPRAGVGR